MRTNRMLWGLIIVTAATFSVVNIISRQYVVAVISFVPGLIWLILEVKQRNPLNSLFFLFFLGVAVLAGLNSAPIPMTLLGLSTDLAAWDLSRFQARLMDEPNSEAKTRLETRHLQRLAVITCAGWFIAWLPTLIKISLDFVVVFVIMLLTMMTLRKSLLYLRDNNTSGA
jgi:hypothetical protein